MSYCETVFEIEGSRDHWTVSTGQSVWKNRLEKLAQTNPEEVKMRASNPDGSVMYHIPRDWLTVRPPKQMNLSDERRAELSERMRSLNSSVSVCKK